MKRVYKTDPFYLRQKAEEMMKKMRLKTASLNSKIETKKVIHDLEVHQIELEMQNEELLQTRSDLRNALDKYTELYDFAPSGYFTLSRDGIIIELNLRSVNMLGIEYSQLKNSQLVKYLSSDTQSIFILFLRKILNSKYRETCEVIFQTDGPLSIYVHLSGILTENGEQCLVTAIDITERKVAEEYGKIGREVLTILNEPEDIKDSIPRVLNLLKKRTEFNAIGIRLQVGDDFPYAAHSGFSDDFLLTENSLISRKGNGMICRDNKGNPLLDCICGKVISGNTDLAHPLFTSGGSAWTNNSITIPDNSPDTFSPHNPRYKCIYDGYASFALVPIRNKDRIVGLIQVSDRLKGFLTLSIVEHLEKIASQIGSALMRKQAEENYRESEKKYGLLFDSMTEGFALHEIILDEKGIPCDYRFLSINPSYEKQTGLKAENIIGKKVTEVLPSSEKYWIETYGNVALTCKSMEFENYLSGSNRYFKVSAFSHKKGYFATIFEDITDLVLAEKELQRTKNYLENLINNANAPIIAWNTDTEIQLFNRAFEHLTGYSADEVKGKKIGILFPKTSLKESQTKIKHSLTQNWETIEVPILTKNKQIRTVLWNSANIFDAGKKTLLSTIAQGNDITERIVAEQKLKERTKDLELSNLRLHKELTERNLAEKALKKSEVQLKELNATKDKFFNIVAHDLKNPFTSLLGSSELLYENIDQMNTESIKKLAIILNDSAKSGYAILQNLLDWSRSQTGLLKFRPEKINLTELINENILNLQLQAANKEIILFSEVNEDILIFADKNMINTVLRNLLSNAVKFTYRHGEVVVGTRIDSDKVIISIKDTGTGISDENIKKLFRIDTKFSSHGTEYEQGTGLGLKLSREFVEKQGGEIWVKSIVDQGSEFLFSIPIKKG